MSRSAEGGGEPSAAVVIPCYKRPGLIVEAVSSALAQRTTFDYRVVLVNDGCPFAQTHDVCTTYQRAYPERVVYLRTVHRGLSGARNAGAHLALAGWPTIQAIQFLDDDDRLWPSFLESALRRLRCHPGVGWVFPDLSHFGAEWGYADFSGPYSVLQHLVDNYCPGTSLVGRPVFEAGVWFDETMTRGFEDWEFWLQAIEAGFRGQALEAPGYRYRVRGASMLRNASPEKQEIFARVRRKHPALFEPRRLLRIEQADLPRFAIVLVEDDQVLLTSDPRCAGRAVPLQEFLEIARVWLARPERAFLPPILAVTSATTLAALVEGGFAPGVFWTLQRLLDRATLATASVELGGPAFTARVRREPGPAAREHEPDIAVVATSCLRERGDPFASQARMEVALGRARAQLPRQRGVTVRLRSLLRQVRGLRAEPAFRPRSVSRVPSRPPSEPLGVYRSALGVEAPLPLAARERGLEAGFVLPASPSDPLIRMVSKLGLDSRRRGLRPHLFQLGAESLAFSPEPGVFETISVLGDPALITAEGLVSLLCAVDVVVNAGSSLVNGILMPLRSLGLRTILLIPEEDAASEGDRIAEALLFEHVLDMVLAPTEKTAILLAARGVPADKLTVAGSATATMALGSPH